MSLECMELDIATFDSVRRRAVPSLGPPLWKTISKLIDVRLRIPELCSHLFLQPPVVEIGGSSPNSRNDEDAEKRNPGKTIVINIINAGLDDAGAQGVSQHFNDGVSTQALPREALIRRAASAIGAGFLTGVDRLSIFSVHNRPRNCEGPTVFSAINEQVLVPQAKVVKSPYRSFLGGNTAFLRYRDTEKEQREAWGDSQSIIDLAEGQAWVETVEGYRASRGYFTRHLNTRFGGCTLKRLNILMDRHTGTRITGALIRKEQMEGRRLLRATETAGICAFGCVTRELTSDEQATGQPINGADSGRAIDFYDPRLEIRDANGVDPYRMSLSECL
ncbi:hypothetical protein A1O7_08569 [Cladophialophora yegresii CBS 114405]|uniref:Uncharacterized protein n=1 Tax=Cladophialophora yegresii CBS 114405 TaxID=1182544 RepID=W9VRJ3_9EURO|nr:uncharacterized protein A1O7_08569 [Cladophialophora yegresii CBS 114405]EXJ55640.1 hypothetical protein A1O7_08569 [Cladophialophora yegresii CBS 114405]